MCFLGWQKFFRAKNHRAALARFPAFSLTSHVKPKQTGMYYVSKRLEIAFAHRLTLDYESKCQRLHGHNGIVIIYCRAKELDRNGMVVDFTHIKRLITDRLDHAFINDLFDFNPTAENLARWICDQVPHCYKVSFQESEGNTAVYVKDGADDAAL